MHLQFTRTVLSIFVLENGSFFFHQCENQLEFDSISKDDQLNWNCNKLSVHNENNLKLNL